MTIAWLDCSAGASGDMLLGALVDAGVPLALMQDAVDALGTEPIRLRAGRTARHGLAAVKVDVEFGAAANDRRWRSIRGMLEGAPLDEEARRLALDAFARLAAAEAAAHGIDAEDVHFHEVGALDSIADIVGAAAGLASLGVARLTASTVTVGGGTTRGSHGSIPLPAPAVLRVLADAGAPVVGAVPYEACTPTGAAIIAAAATGYGPLPEMVVERVGAGAGGRDPQERANLLRIVVGREIEAPRRAAHVHRGGAGAPAPERGHADGHGHDHDRDRDRDVDHDHRSPSDSAARADGQQSDAAGAQGRHHGPHFESDARQSAPSGTPVVIETNVDDLDPRLWPSALAALLDAGASDAWLTPILMKKGRPAHTVHVLCRADAVAAVRSALVRHTTTIGMRSYEIDKYALERRYTRVDVDGHAIGVKIALEGGEVVNASVEYEDAAAAAAALGRSLKVVVAQATALAAQEYPR
ncbi:nickel pincer cofactor biosynthesis protein LarC [Glycomyces albidus]|uniref:Pyridinium-3,5-bisthiocarboxylic acid mononucleotide nickel insertion protein n=1 Tax=Glycomyces albidus TaxID=2656774 RepID=A0A6L5GEZ1_9ACTN|nr:nickel pincer cofactor biosynthesis protein LarC [Glycomyces albidus]MQM28151.1 nickel pincer cofactor biosynthesis protein LarC [Glycomyces albidus]